MEVLFSVDCDFEGYAPLDKKSIKFNEKKFYKVLEFCINETLSLDIKKVFLIHTSIFTRNHFNDLFYTDDKYLKLYHKAVDNGAFIGIHPHEDDEKGKYFLYFYSRYMEKVIDEAVSKLKKSAIKPEYIRFGYFCLNNFNAFIVKKHNLISLDNMGGYFHLSKANFLCCPDYHYTASIYDIEEKDSNGIDIIPVGFYREENLVLWNSLVLDSISEKKAKYLIDKIFLKNPDNVVCTLVHTFNFKKNLKKIKNVVNYINSLKR